MGLLRLPVGRLSRFRAISPCCAWPVGIVYCCVNGQLAASSAGCKKCDCATLQQSLLRCGQVKWLCDSQSTASASPQHLFEQVTTTQVRSAVPNVRRTYVCTRFKQQVRGSQAIAPSAYRRYAQCTRRRECVIHFTTASVRASACFQCARQSVLLIIAGYCGPRNSLACPQAVRGCCRYLIA